MNRTTTEKFFLFVFLPLVVFIYTIKSYPGWVTGPLGIDDPFGDFFFIFGKSPNFWYQSLYTGIVVCICLRILLQGKNPYGRKGLSKYQRSKFTSILLAQLIGFYLIPFVVPMIKSGTWTDTSPKIEISITKPTKNIELERTISYSPTHPKYQLLVYANDTLISPDQYQVTPLDPNSTSKKAKSISFNEELQIGTKLKVTAFHLTHKMAHVYVSPAFFSTFAFSYMFIIIPIFVWFFGKRYCSWICACGNLAETVGTTKWGSKWVKEGTPRGEKSLHLEIIQIVMLIFSIVVGLSAILNVYHVINPGLHDRLWYVQDFLTDFMFGSLIGVGLYPFFGTRIWCRYGCPMARWMKLFGRWSRSHFAVIPSDKCKGIGLCSQACPMGIPVADYAHKDKKPIEISFGLHSTPCIGCGGCVDSCPVDALSFQKVGGQTVIATRPPAHAEKVQ